MLTTTRPPTHAPTTGCNSTVQICDATRHGTEDAYRHARCRCDTARAAMARYQNARLLDILAGRSRTLPNIGAVRRVQALRALGYTSRDLATRIGVDERNIARWPHRNWISRRHHDAVCRVYDALAGTLGPDERARRHAARQGWLPPAAWDNDELDDPSGRLHPEWLMCSVDLCTKPVKASGYCNAHHLRWKRHGHPLAGGSFRSRDPQRVLERIDKRPDGCWIWTGTIAPDGYGRVTIDHKAHRAHRLVYTLLVGPIPDGLTLDHLCHTDDRACSGGTTCLHRRCVNPGHLEPVTAEENSTRGGHSRREECRRGHPLDVVVRRSNGRTERRCSRCHREREAARRKTDVDPVRVDRAIAGQPVDLTRAERLEAVRQLRARRLGYDAIADRLRVAARQVHRDLTDLGLVQTEAGAA